jgi:hypothetical protein
VDLVRNLMLVLVEIGQGTDSALADIVMVLVVESLNMMGPGVCSGVTPNSFTSRCFVVQRSAALQTYTTFPD